MTGRIEMAQQYPCPKCNAGVGAPCVSSSGVSHAGFAHSPRTKLLKQPRTFAQAETLGMQCGVGSATTTLRNAECALQQAEARRLEAFADWREEAVHRGAVISLRKAVQQAEAWLVEARAAAKARKRVGAKRT